MSQPGVIDGLQFARSAGVLRGKLHPSQLSRLAEAQCATEGVTFELFGIIDPEGRPKLRISVRGGLRFVCQRCLDPVEFPLEIDSELLFAGSEREIAESDDDVDRVLAGKAMEVSVLVEDEILLVLPMVPKHEHCQAAAVGEDQRRSSPFAVLGKLKG